MISIVIPTYKEEGYIEATLKNLAPLRASGRKKDFEIIISDAASPDRTVAIAKPYADKIVIIKAGRKRSIPQGRNDGAFAARGEYIAFMDADVTIPDPLKFFADARGLFEKDPNLLAITAQIKVHPPLARWSDKMIYGILNRYFAVMNNTFNIGMAGGEFMMIRTSAFRSVGGFNEDLAASEDMDLFYRLSREGHTRLPWQLTIFHTGRRLHQSGWIPTVYRWTKNAFMVRFFQKSSDKEWEAIR